MRTLIRKLLTAVGRMVVREDPFEHADVAVVLGGAPRYRCPTAAAMLKQQRVQQIVVVGGLKGHQEAKRSALILSEMGIPDLSVHVIERDAPGTWEEACLVAEEARQRGWKRLVVVTSAYHTRRARWLFQAACSADTQVCVKAAADEPWSPTSWWRSRLHRKLFFAEPLKAAAWRCGLRRWLRR